MPETSVKWSLTVVGDKRRTYHLLQETDGPAAGEWLADAEPVNPDTPDDDVLAGYIRIDDMLRLARLLNVLLPGGTDGMGYGKTAKFVDEVSLHASLEAEGIRGSASLCCDYDKCQQQGLLNLLWHNDSVRLLAAAVDARDTLAEAIKESKT